MRPSSRIAILATLFVAAGAAEPGNRSPLDDSSYLEVPRWFTAPPAYATRHLAPAAVVAAVDAGSPAGKAGLAIGDRLIGIDGRRVHDAREIRLLRSAMPSRHDQETWTIERGQQCLTLTVAGLDPFRSTGATLSVPADVPDCAALLAPLGVPMPAADAEALRWLPGRVSHAFADWLGSPSGAKSVRDAPWIGAWVATYLHVLRGEPVTQPTTAIPEPFLEQLDQFHRAIAGHRAAGKPSCALEELGCDAWFCALFYPYPAGTAAAFGTPTLSPQMVAVLRRLYDDPLGSWPQRHFVATHLTMQPRGLERYLHDISCALIDFPSWYEMRFHMLLERGVQDWDPASRPGMLAELTRRFAAQVDDADAAGVALCVALASAGRCGDANQVTATLATRSPYLAWRARELARFVVQRHGTPADLAILTDDAARNPYAGPAPYPEIYGGTQLSCPSLASLAGGCDADPQHGLPALFRARPELVAAGLERRFWSPDRDHWSVYDACGQGINNTAWRIASRQPYADAGQALQCAQMILSVTGGGEWLDVDTKDTVAACLARGGDFTAAVRMEQEAVAQLPPLWPAQLAEFSKRLALYQAHQVADEPRAADEPTDELVEARLAWPGGQPRAQGHTCAGARTGPWRFYDATGALEATCSYWAGVVDGPARSYYADGTVKIEGFFSNWGERTGRWRCWHPGGMLASDGTYVLNGRVPQKCGEWLWFDAAGHRLESGNFSYDQRVGPWAAWDRAGKRIQDDAFVAGTPQPATGRKWREGALIDPPSPEPVPATAEEFVARGAARHRVYEFAGTLADFTRAIELAPDLASAWAGRAKARVDMSDFAGARSDADRAIALGAADATVYRVRAAALAGSGDRAGAERDYTQAIAIAPADRDALFGRGRSRDAAGDHAGAIADFTTVLGLKPDDSEARYCRGEARQKAGDLAAAISDFTTMIAKDRSSTLAYDHLAELKAATGDRAGAIAVMDALIASAPWYGDAFLRRGYLKQDGGAMEDALSDFTHTIVLQPGNIIGYPARGALLCDLGRLPEALADYRRLPAIVYPGSNYTESTHLRIWLIRTRMGEGPAAVTELREYLATRTPPAAPDWMLAVMRFAVGQLAEADLLATLPSQETPPGSEAACVAHYYIGAARIFAGDPAGAIDHFRKCLATGRRDVNEIRSAEAELARLVPLRK